jgi:excisionase family DNA binding protein
MRTKRSRPHATASQLCEQGLFKPLEAARFLGIGRTSLFELLRTGALPYVRILGERRIPRRACIAFAEARLVQRDESSVA